MVSFNLFGSLAINWPANQWSHNFRVDRFLALNVHLMSQSACWPVNFRRWLPVAFAFLSHPLQWLHFCVALFACLHLAVLFLYSFVHKMLYPTEHTTLTEISDCFIQSLIYTFTFITLVYYRCRHGKVAEMMAFMDGNFKRRSVIGSTYVTAEPTYWLVKRITTIWFGMLFSTVMVLTMQPLLALQWELPFSQILYPFDVQSNVFVFVGVYAFQFLGQLMVASVISNFENHLLCSSVLMCGQLDILFCSIKNIRRTAMLLNDIRNRDSLKLSNIDEVEANEYYYAFEMKEDLDNLNFLQNEINNETSAFAPLNRTNRGRSDDTYLMTYDHELGIALRSCIHHHNVILKMHKLMEDFFNPLILLASMQATVQICNSLYTSSKPTPIEDKIHNLQYLSAVTMAIVMIGYAGDCLKAHSQGIRTALARSAWHLCGGPFRRDMLIIMKNTLKPMVLTGGKFFILDYEKIKAILSASFSYYTFLDNIG